MDLLEKFSPPKKVLILGSPPEKGGKNKNKKIP
jgi:hypothetical protein